MTIRIRWSAALAPYTGGTDRAQIANWSADLTPTLIAAAAGLSEADRTAVLAFVNGALAPIDAPLDDGDEVLFDITIHGR